MPIEFMQFPLTTLTEWSRTLDYATARKLSRFKTREHHQNALFIRFYFKDFKYFDNARMFCITGRFGVF